MPPQSRSGVNFFTAAHWWRWPRSTTSRIAVLVFFALVGSSVIILGFISWVTQGQLDRDAQSLIAAERAAIVETFKQGGPSAAHTAVGIVNLIPGAKAALLEGPNGVKTGNITAWPLGLEADGRLNRLDITRLGKSSSEPFIVTTQALPGGYRLLVGRGLAEQQRLTATLTTSLAAAVGLALLLAFGVSPLLARIIARRVQGIADVASAVAAGDLSRRINVPTENSPDAFDRLGISLNAMLTRIEALLDELRSVTDGLAHDLRSPLTRLKARIDRVQQRGDASGADIAAIGSEADALLDMLDNSLEISRAEAGIGRDSFVHMDLAALVNDMVEMYAPLAEDNGVRVAALTAGPVPVLVHRELLGRTLSNLIDNALRYAAAGGIIEVGAMLTAEGAELIVADRGPGIASADREDALRRFGRLDVSRSTGGAGLGLSLAVAIARLHDGKLNLSDNNPGLLVTMTFPGG